MIKIFVNDVAFYQTIETVENCKGVQNDLESNLSLVQSVANETESFQM